MSANTEMSRLDSLPTATLNKLLDMSEEAILPTAVSKPKDGDVLVYDGTAKKWKNGSGGGGSGVLVVHESYDSATSTWTMDTVASEIWSAMQTGLAIVVSDISSSVIANAQYVPEDSEEYYFVICDNAGPGVYSAANGDDYPARVMS